MVDKHGQADDDAESEPFDNPGSHDLKQNNEEARPWLNRTRDGRRREETFLKRSDK